MEIKVYNNIFENEYKTFEYDTTKPLLEQLEEHIEKNTYRETLVECYDPQTGETFYAPMLDEEIENPSVMIVVDGKTVDKEYQPKEGELVSVVFLPASSNAAGGAAAGAILGAMAGIAIAGLITASLLTTFGGGILGIGWAASVLQSAPTLFGLLGVSGAIIGGIAGYEWGKNKDKALGDGTSDNGKQGTQSPDVRGAENSSIKGENFAFVIGKHLVSPRIIGDPITEYSGHNGEDAYIRVLYNLGYAPLKLTDFKLGEFILAYNRDHKIADGTTVECGTYVSGHLKGYSRGNVPDSGDIVDYWKNNDIELEIIQQPNTTGEAITIDDYYQNNTAIDLANRPQVSAATMQAAGWDVPSGETCTVYSVAYSNENETKTVLVTPINPDGTVLTPAQLDEVADDCLVPSQPIVATVNFNVSDSPAPYRDRYLVNSMKLSLNAVISKSVELQLQNDNAWTSILTVPSGAISASVTGGTRYGGHVCRIKIGSWTSDAFDVLGSGTETINTPETDYAPEHPQNLLATFTGTDSVEQSTIYAEGLHENQEAFYNQGHYSDGVNYGHIYTSTYDDQQINANLFYIADKELDETAKVVYKGSEFPNKFRTNGVFFTAACPMEFTITLDFQSGIYDTYTKTQDNSTTTKYDPIPLYLCVQWRIYNSNNKSSDPTGKDYDDWNTIQIGTMKTLNESNALADKNKHKGNDFGNNTLEDIYGGFYGKQVSDFSSYSGEDGISEIRVSKTITLTKAQCKEILADTNKGRLIEVRVLRVSPNYMNMVSDEGLPDGESAHSYSDHVRVTSILTKVFDEDKLKKEDTLVDIKPLSDDDYKKFCLVAIKAKADASGYLSQQLKSLNCVAESFSPIWDFNTKKVLPENISTQIKYFGYYEGNDRVNRSSREGVEERVVDKPVYEQARRDGFNWYAQDCGTNFASVMKGIVFKSENCYTHNDSPAYKLTEDAAKYNNNTVASGFLLGCVGPQNGPISIGYDGINLAAIGEWAEKTIALTDGSTFDADTVYNGVQYHKDDLIPVRMEANGYVYAATKLEDLLQKLSFCGRAAWYVDENGKISVIMDAPADYTKGVINSQNCISSSNAFSYEEPPAGLFISYSDENDGYQTNQFYCWSDGNSIKSYHGQVEPYSVEFVTNPYQMWSLGRYLLALREMNKEVLTRKIGPEGVTFNLGDVVLVQSEDLLIGDCSGRVQEVIEDENKIYGFVCDAPYEYKAEEGEGGNSTQGVTIMQPRYYGKSNAVTLPISMPRTQPVGDKSYTLAKGTTNVVLFAEGGVSKGDNNPSPTQNVKYNIKTGDICMFGLRDLISAPYRITKIKPEKDGCFTQTLIPYDEGLYNAGEQIPSFQSFMPPPVVEEAPVSLSEVPTTIAEQNDAFKQVYDAIGIAKDTTPPEVPFNVSAVATRDMIKLAWENLGTNVKQTIIQMSKSNGGTNTWVQVAVVDSDNWEYYFTRTGTGSDGYPEASDLSHYKFRLKNVSICNIESDFTTNISVDTTTSYGTWVPATPTFINKTPDEGGITFDWAAATSSISGKELYGTPVYTITTYRGNGVSRIDTTKETKFIYQFHRASEGYPEVTGTQDYLGLSDYTFSLTISNESGNTVTLSPRHFSAYELSLYGTWIPAVPTKKSIEAEQDGIAIEWNVASGKDGKKLYGGVTYKAYVYYDNSGTTEARGTLTSDGLRTFYTFTRTGQNADGYPEKSTVQGNYPKLDDYSVKFEAINTTTGDNRSSGLGTAQTVEETNYKTWIPVEPTNILGVAEENGINFTWDDTSDCYGINHYTLSLQAATGSIPQIIDAKQFFYNFLRSAIDYQEVTPVGTENPQEEGWFVLSGDNYILTTDTTVDPQQTYYEAVRVVKDGYPEASELLNWNYTITAVNKQSGRSSESSSQTVGVDSYLGWLPNAPVIDTRASGRTCSLSMVNTDRHYGKIRYKVMVCRPDQDYEEVGGERTYKYYLPVPTSNPFGDEDNYKANAEATPPITPVLNQPILTDSVYTQTMPLKDQTATVYKKYSFKFEYLQVVPVGTENPQEEGWYEYDGTDYVLTTDTTVDDSKVYYRTNCYDYDTGTTKLLVYTDTQPSSTATQHDVYIDGVLVEDAWCWTDSTTGLNYISFEVSMPSPKDTVYWWKVAAYNDTTESLISKTSNYVTEQDGIKVLTNAKATSAFDVVKAGITENALAPDAVTTDKIAAGTITAQKILVETLAAISANLGKITDGELYGNESNYWYISEPNDPQDTHHAGDFQVGTVNGDYIRCTYNPTNHNYDVDIHASKFILTAIGTVVKGAFYVSPTNASINPNTGIPDSYYARIDQDKIRYNLGAEYANFEVGEISQGSELTYFRVRGGNHWEVIAGGFTTDGFIGASYATGRFFVHNPNNHDDDRFFSANTWDTSLHNVPGRTVEIHKGDFILTDTNNSTKASITQAGDISGASASVSGAISGASLDVSGNISVGKNGQIIAQGTKANYAVIKTKDNTSDTYGNGVVIGGGGAVVIGAGESADTYYSGAGLTAGDENTRITSDSNIYFAANCNNGYASRKEMTLDTNGDLSVPSGILASSNVLGSNLPIFGTCYSAGTYNSGYFLLAQLEGEASTGNHDVAMAGRVLKDSAGTIQISDFYVYARGNNATVGTAMFDVVDVRSAVPLVATYEVFSTNRYRIRLYGQITNNWQKFNTVIHYASGGDVSARVSNLTVTFPNTQSASVTGTQITKVTNLKSGSVADAGNGTTTTFAYSKAGLTGNPSWLAAWNGYELRAIEPAQITAGNAKKLNCAPYINDVGIIFRDDTTWSVTGSYQTAGNEAMVFATKNAATSWIFINGEDSITNHANNRWQSLTPALQIKNGKVAIGKLIANSVTPTYALDVNGTVNATTFRGSLNGNADTATTATTANKIRTSNSNPANGDIWIE